MGIYPSTLGNPADMPAAVPPIGTAATLFRGKEAVLPEFPGAGAAFAPAPPYAAPRCSASQTAVLSRTPSSTARPQCAIHAATPSGVPET